MFTQFFGNFLLGKQLVTKEQLLEALSKLPQCRLKLGTLAINAKYLNARQVEEIHSRQAREDRRFGDIAKEMGYLTEEQISKLLCEQPTNHLLLGQTLIDMGAMNEDQFEFALNTYMRQNYLTDADFTNSQNYKIENIIKDFYKLGGTTKSKLYVEYLMLLYKNLIRFIGDDFAPMNIEQKASIDAEFSVRQTIQGEDNTFASIVSCDDEGSLIEFARRYSKDLSVDDIEYAYECISEFLNVNNGVYTVNVCNSLSIDLELDPPENQNVEGLQFKDKVLCAPVCFAFGTVRFILAPKNLCL